MHDEPQDLSAMTTGTASSEGFEILLIAPPNSMVEKELPSKLQAYGIHLTALTNMDRIEEVVLSQQQDDKASHKKYACLVYEDLYKEDSYRAFSKKTKSVLLSYGPKFLVRDSREHFICPLQVLPSVLMKRLSKHVASVDAAEKGTSSSSYPSTSTGTSQVKDCTKPPGRNGNAVRDPALPKPRRLQNFRILVAEDNKINQKVIGGMMKRLGVGHYEIANNGKEAVEKESATEFDLILMDMQASVCIHFLSCPSSDTETRPKTNKGVLTLKPSLSLSLSLYLSLLACVCVFVFVADAGHGRDRSVQGDCCKEGR